MSPFGRRHVFSGNLVYQFPFGKGQHWAKSGIGNALFGGFSLTGIVSSYSGAPLAMTQSASNGLGVGSARPDVVGDETCAFDAASTMRPEMGGVADGTTYEPLPQVAPVLP